MLVYSEKAIKTLYETPLGDYVIVKCNLNNVIFSFYGVFKDIMYENGHRAQDGDNFIFEVEYSQNPTTSKNLSIRVDRILEASSDFLDLEYFAEKNFYKIE